MDFSRRDLKRHVFKDKKKYIVPTGVSSLSQNFHAKKTDHSKHANSKEHNLNWRKHKVDDDTYTKLKFRTADMNDPDILKGFLRLNGIPNRPY
jgi:hypothetical protein